MGYAWTSSNGLFQIWESHKVGDDWYIFRRVDVAGAKYLSRQAWIPQSPDHLLRVSETSYDDGETWQTRFREQYVRLEASAAGTSRVP